MRNINFLLNNNDTNNAFIIPINLGEDIEAVEDFMIKNGYNFSVFLDEETNIAKLYNINSVPTMIFIDEEKNIFDVKIGYCSNEEIINILNNMK